MVGTPPHIVPEDFKYSSVSEDERGPWMTNDTLTLSDAEKDIKYQYKRAMIETEVDDPVHRRFMQFYKDNLKMDKFQMTE